MEKKEFEQAVKPFEEWAEQDKEHRAVIVLTIDDSDKGELKSDEFIIGNNTTIIPALAHKKIKVGNGLFGSLLRKADNLMARTIVHKMMGLNEEDAE